MSIGTRVKEARTLRGLSQSALAARIGIRQPTLSQLESGESASTTYIARIAAVLGVSPLWLETGKGPREGSQEAPAVGFAGALELKVETAAELRLLSVYRLADAREREAIDNVVEQIRLLVEARNAGARPS